MKRWLVRLTRHDDGRVYECDRTPDTTGGVLLLQNGSPGWPELVLALGIGAWHSIEPVPPTPTEET